MFWRLRIGVRSAFVSIAALARRLPISGGSRRCRPIVAADRPTTTAGKNPPQAATTGNTVEQTGAGNHRSDGTRPSCDHLRTPGKLVAGTAGRSSRRDRHLRRGRPRTHLPERHQARCRTMHDATTWRGVARPAASEGRPRRARAARRTGSRRGRRVEQMVVVMVADRAPGYPRCRASRCRRRAGFPVPFPHIATR